MHWNLPEHQSIGAYFLEWKTRIRNTADGKHTTSYYRTKWTLINICRRAPTRPTILSRSTILYSSLFSSSILESWNTVIDSDSVVYRLLQRAKIELYRSLDWLEQDTNNNICSPAFLLNNNMLASHRSTWSKEIISKMHVSEALPRPLFFHGGLATWQHHHHQEQDTLRVTS